MIKEAFEELYPGKAFNYEPRLVYSNRFKDYNANVKLRGNVLEFGLSKKWADVSIEIKKGLVQELLIKLLGGKDTIYTDLYNKFIKNLHIAIPKDKTHPVLEDSFNRVNDKHFYGLIEQPNLVFGRLSKTKLGSYDYKSDIISISKIFLKSNSNLLDYIMYHEILHKKHKFESKNGRSRFHDSKFRKDEKMFENSSEIEKELERFIRRLRLKRFLFGD